jgi:hypothetical protein
MDDGPEHEVDPFALDWGSITPDSISRDGVAIHTIAHDLATPAGLSRTLRFVDARVALFARHLPDGTKQGVIFDDRGQDLPAQTRDALRAGLPAHLAFVRFMSEGIGDL